ncbi:MAG: helix-turn-helix domain-containing protein [Actinomycetes bacterium]
MPGPEHTLDVSDPRALRALAHPLRLQLLRLVREHRPVTGARLAELTGESSASVSYHLSILARHGFVEPDPTPGPTRRHKPWRTTFEAMRIVGEHAGQAPIDTVEGAVLGHLLTEVRAQQDAYVRGTAGLQPPWQDAATFELTRLRLTAAELEELSGEVDEVLQRYRGRVVAADPDRAAFSVSFIAVPTSPAAPGDVRS